MCVCPIITGFVPYSALCSDISGFFKCVWDWTNSSRSSQEIHHLLQRESPSKAPPNGSGQSSQNVFRIETRIYGKVFLYIFIILSLYLSPQNDIWPLTLLFLCPFRPLAASLSQCVTLNPWYEWLSPMPVCISGIMSMKMMSIWPFGLCSKASSAPKSLALWEAWER